MSINVSPYLERAFIPYGRGFPQTSQAFKNRFSASTAIYATAAISRITTITTVIDKILRRTTTTTATATDITTKTSITVYTQSVRTDTNTAQTVLIIWCTPITANSTITEVAVGIHTGSITAGVTRLATR
jgi:hypothetical protein